MPTDPGCCSCPAAVHGVWRALLSRPPSGRAARRHGAQCRLGWLCPAACVRGARPCAGLRSSAAGGLAGGPRDLRALPSMLPSRPAASQKALRLAPSACLRRRRRRPRRCLGRSPGPPGGQGWPRPGRARPGRRAGRAGSG